MCASSLLNRQKSDKPAVRSRRKIRWITYGGLVLVLALFSAGCANRAFYYPDSRVYGTPSMPYEAVSFKSLDDTELTGWFVPALTNRIGTVIQFHGNAQNMTAHFSYIDWLPARGFDVFVFDYRGYGQSGGRLSRKGIFEDGIAALNYVISRPDVNPRDVVVLGQSLGGAVAGPALADDRTPAVRALALDATFNSYREMARLKIADMPLVGLLRVPLAWWCVSGRYEPKDAIGRIENTPIMVFHGDDDRVIPIFQGRRLFEGAREPKSFVTIPRGRHTSAFVIPDDQFRQKLVDFYSEALRK